MSAPNRKVAWIKPQEPSFIKAFKAKVGYKEPDTIEAKRPKVDPPTGGEGDEEEREDELPTVVELEKGDVGEEEYKKFCEAMKEMKNEEEKEGEGSGSGVPTASPRPLGGDQSEGESVGGRIVFKRPAKRRRSSEGVLDASTRKTGGEEASVTSRGPGGKTKSPRTRRRSGSSSGVKNSSLLSFGDEED